MADGDLRAGADSGAGHAGFVYVTHGHACSGDFYAGPPYGHNGSCRHLGSDGNAGTNSNTRADEHADSNGYAGANSHPDSHATFL